MEELDEGEVVANEGFSVEAGTGELVTDDELSMLEVSVVDTVAGGRVSMERLGAIELVTNEGLSVSDLDEVEPGWEAGLFTVPLLDVAVAEDDSESELDVVADVVVLKDEDMLDNEVVSEIADSDDRTMSEEVAVAEDDSDGELKIGVDVVMLEDEAEKLIDDVPEDSEFSNVEDDKLLDVDDFSEDTDGVVDILKTLVEVFGEEELEDRAELEIANALQVPNPDWHPASQ
jgi:hypothetical protein